MRLGSGLGVYLLLASNALADDAKIADPICPSGVSTRQEAASLPAGFTSRVSSDPQPLKSIDFYDGTPGAQGTIVARSEEPSSAGAAMVISWRLAARKGRDNYAVCNYDGTSVSLVRELDPALHRCTITYNPAIQVGGVPLIISSNCT